MKKPFKIIITTAIILGIAVLAVVSFKDYLIKIAVEVGVSQVMGAAVHIEEMSISPLRHAVSVRGLKVDNPPGFPKGVLIDITAVDVDYDLPAILKGKLHLPRVILKLDHVTVIKDKQGRLNVDALKIVQNLQSFFADAGSAKDMLFQIDMLKLDLGRVVVVDHGKTPPTVNAKDIGIRNKTYRNITSVPQLVALIMVESLRRTAIKNAAIYGVASVLGVSFLPAGVAGILFAKDSCVGKYRVDVSRVYEALFRIISKRGQVETEDKNSGTIRAKINGARVTAVCESRDGQTTVTISARQMFLPKPEIAGGLIYQLSKEIE